MNEYIYAHQACKHFGKLYGKSTIQHFDNYNQLVAMFKKTFKRNFCYLVSSPGRVELVGNHTDHNGGLVAGCAINLDIIGAFRENDDNVVRIVSKSRRAIQFPISQVQQVEPNSIGIVKGVFAYLSNKGYKVGGVDVVTHSSVPTGAGISSSAAFELLVATIINHLYNDGQIPLEEMVHAGQYAENVYFGKPCGLLDQSVVAFGGVVKLDFSSGLQCNSLQLPTSQLQLVLVDTGNSHASLNELYASIPNEMKQVALLFGKERLIDVNKNDFFAQYEQVTQRLGVRPALRAKHFFEENQRVEQFCQALQSQNVNVATEIVNASGDSSLYQLQNCAVDENDFAISNAVSFARSLANCGARVHGGGFAGTVLCVVAKQDAPSFVAKLQQKYGKQHVLPLQIRSVGATVL